MRILRLLGGLSLETDLDQPVGRAAQKRRLALLAYLASRPGAATTRDKLLALFWPEASSEGARHRLSAALYDLRRALGDDVVLTRGDDVVVSEGTIRCDVIDFEAAIAAEEFGTAIALYRGPFLDGVHIEDAPEFDEWVEQRRTQLSRAFARALEEWARVCAERREFTAAVDAWQRLADTDALSDRLALGLMKAMEAAGNRAGALRHFALHVERLRSDLRVEPDHALRQYAATLRAVSPAPIATAPHVTRVFPPVPSTEDVGAPPAAVLQGQPHLSRTGFRAWFTRAAIVTALILAAFSLRNMSAQPRADPGSSPSAVDAYHEGEVHLASGRFDLAVSAFERAIDLDSTMAPAYFQHAVATLWADQPGDRIEAHLRAAVERRDRLDGHTRSLLDGFVAWRRGDWHQAEGVYRRALTTSRGSIPARYELGEVLFHYSAPQGRSIDESREQFEQVIRRQPSHFGALWHLALLAARDARHGDVKSLTGRLLALGPDSIRTLEVQAVRAAALHEGGTMQQLIERLQDADESLLFGIGWRMAVFSRDLESAGRVFSLLTAPRRSPYAHALGHAQLFNLAMAREDFGEAKAHLDVLAMSDIGLPVGWLQLLAAMVPGSPVGTAELKVLRDSLLAIDASGLSSASLYHRSAILTTLGSTLALLGDADRALSVAARIERLSGTPSDSLRWFDANVGRAATVRALVARQAGKPNDVLRFTGPSLVFRWFGGALVDPMGSYVLQRYIHAEALHAVGRLDEADAWFASIGLHDPADFALLGVAARQRARIANERSDQLAAQKTKATLGARRAANPD